MNDEFTINSNFKQNVDAILEVSIDPQIQRQAYIAKSSPSNNEVGWLGHKERETFKGTKDRVQVKFDPTDEEIKENYIYHTHPSENPSPLTAMPSGQDLMSAVESAKYGIQGIVIFSGKSKQFYTVVVPTNRTDLSKSKINRYEEAIKRGDIEDSIKHLERMKFDVETGIA